MSIAIPFPEKLPNGYKWLSGETPFDPTKHLSLESPKQMLYLEDLGYAPEEIRDKATKFAVSEPFRILSPEGSEIMLETARRLKPFSRRAGNRIENTVRGGCYRSRWLRDLCTSQDVCDLMASIYKTEISPHTMPVHLGHLNYQPTKLEEAVDKWHHDTIPLDYVMMVSDPKKLHGGGFEYFLGTKIEVEEFSKKGKTPPLERVKTPVFPDPGYAIALHGNMVVHRGAPLKKPGERITLVNAYVSTNCLVDDQSRSRDLIGIDDPSSLYTEWAKHASWRTQNRLKKIIDPMAFDHDPKEVLDKLESAAKDLVKTIDDMKSGPREAQHYEH